MRVRITTSLLAVLVLSSVVPLVAETPATKGYLIDVSVPETVASLGPGLSVTVAARSYSFFGEELKSHTGIEYVPPTPKAPSQYRWYRLRSAYEIGTGKTYSNLTVDSRKATVKVFEAVRNADGSVVPTRRVR